MSLKLRPYSVSVIGFDAVTYFAATPGKARAQGWRSYCNYREVPFREFLQVSVVRRGVAPAEFGKEVLVAGLPAFLVAFAAYGNCHYFVRPDSDLVLLAHENDFEGLPERKVA